MQEMDSFRNSRNQLNIWHMKKNTSFDEKKDFICYVFIKLQNKTTDLKCLSNSINNVFSCHDVHVIQYKK